MQKTNQYKSVLITSICFLAFFLFGFTDNLKGPTLPAMLTELKINYGTGGNIFFGEYFGFLIATMITGIIADKFGLKSVLVFAGICLAIGVSGYSTFQNTVLLSLSLFIIGLGLGAFELGPNAIIVEIHKERKGLFLNLMAVLHGLGSLIAPLFAGWLFTLSISWHVVYRWDLVLIAVFLGIALVLRFPKSEEKTQIDFRNIPKFAFKGNLPLFYLAIGLYVAAEIGVASWLVTYLQEIRETPIITSNQYLSLFFALLMIGRLIGGFFVQRLGYVRSILFAALGSVICLAVGTFTSLVIFLPLTGFFFSIVFPTITAAVSDEATQNANTILGTLFTFAGVGGVIGPWLIGWTGTAFGLQAGFGVNLVITTLFLISLFFLMKGMQNGAKS
ncbi:MAG: MFS transporter [Anaerolineales bacterium]|nr:MFS transporter [Anaerolineales bacterium]